ncbi:MAG TPA: hypothetical protein VFP34_14395 [Microlunatus sp.]|nr:hypothetical protein [Microlunatus sp.]
MSKTTVRQKIGLAIGGVFLAANVPSAFDASSAGEAGPPLAVLVADSVLAVIGLVAVVVAYATGRAMAIRAAAGSLILIALTAVPAFFSPVPPAVRLMVGAVVIVTVVASVLMLAPARSRAEEPVEVTLR